MRCLLARWQVSGALDRGGARSRWCTAHVERCPGCHAYADSMAALHQRLLAGAAGAPAPSVVGRRPHVRPRSLVGGFAVTAAAALYLWVAGGGGVHVLDQGTGEDVVESRVRGRAASQPSGSADGVVPRGRAERVVARAAALLDAPPLRLELAALASDGARGARVVLSSGGLAGLVERNPR
jgi:hypothetical protein